MIVWQELKVQEYMNIEERKVVMFVMWTIKKRSGRSSVVVFVEGQ